jgi:alpha-glucosidase
MNTQAFGTIKSTWKLSLLIFLVGSCLFYQGLAQESQGFAFSNDYAVLSETVNAEQTEYTALVGYTGENNYYINTTNPIIPALSFSLVFQSASQFQIRITDATHQRWEIPTEAPFPFADPTKKVPIDTGLAVVEINKNPFWFKVTRKSTGEVLFDTSAGNFMFSDYYIELSTSVPSGYMYGFGERGYNLTLGPTGIYTIWNADYNQNIETGLGGHNSYGSHPVYMVQEQSKDWSMVLLRNVNAMDVILNNSKSLTYKITGGILDFNFFLGDNYPETVITSYHKYLGGWAIPPFWSLGYQQSRWGYDNLTFMKEIVDTFTELKMPLDVIWSDIDYMNEYVDFTIDENRFPLSEFNEMLKTTGKRWVPIIDAGIGVEGKEVYQRGLDQDVYIKAPNGTTLVGSVWPGGTSFVDWFHPNASDFWTTGLENVRDMVPYSGLWLDMNEISNLIDGEIGFVPNMSDIKNALPYTPGNPLYTDAIRLDAVHYNGEIDFNTHSLFHFMECNITYNYLKEQSELPFILSRSNMFGSGKFAFHWTGDNNSSWVFMKVSIPSIMNFNMFGIPMTGSDICGFKKNTTEELCARWMQLGLLYPFSRNHAENDTIRQEPWMLGPTVLETSKIAISVKYSLLKYYYSLFIEKSGYGTVFRPVFYEFPTDANLMTTEMLFVDSEFLLGRGLLSAPVLDPGVESVDVYLPADRWFDFFSGEVLHSQYDAGAIVKDYPAPLNSTIPLFLRGGFVVPTQDTANVLRSDDLDNNYTLVIGLKETESSEQYEAQGKILAVSDFSESSVSEKCVENNCFLNVNVNANSSPVRCETEITFTSEDDHADLEKVGVRSVQVYGCFSDKTPAPQNQWVLNQVYYNGKYIGGGLQRGNPNNVFDVTLNNDLPLIISSGDSIVISSQYINH